MGNKQGTNIATEIVYKTRAVVPREGRSKIKIRIRRKGHTHDAYLHPTKGWRFRRK